MVALGTGALDRVETDVWEGVSRSHDYSGVFSVTEDTP